MNTYRKTLYLMGTVITLYFKGDQAEKIVTEASKMLVSFEKRFSANLDDAPLAMLKKEAYKRPLKVDPDLYDLIKIGKAHSSQEGSFLNIAIDPLIKLWRIGFKEAHIPNHDAILKVLDLMHVDNIVLDDTAQTVFLKREGMSIDLGAIAKGYFCDQVMAYFKAQGAISAMVDLGGNVLVYGDAPSGNATWKVGIQNPFLPRGNLVARVNVRNQSVVTSGIYERVLKGEQGTYHHIFNCETGYPIDNNIASLTIIASRSLDCDIYTTKFFGLDFSTIINKVNQLPDLAAIVITRDGKMAHTSNLNESIDYL